MAKYEQKDNTGTLFINNRKQNDRQPDRTGTVMIDGVEYYLSGWDKSGPSGDRINLAVTKKEAKQEQRQDAKQASYDRQKPAPADDFDVPF